MVTPYGRPDYTRTRASFVELEDELRRLERRGLGSWGMAAALLLALTIATIVLYVFSLTGTPVPWRPASQGTMVIGLTGLVLMFVFYVLFKQQELARVRIELVRSRMTASQLESNLSDVTGLFEASVELAVSGDPRKLSAAALAHLRAALRADAAALYVIDDAHGAELVVCDPPLSRTYSGPSLDAVARRALASPPEHPQARALPRSVGAGTVLLAPFVTGMRDGGRRAALYAVRDPREAPFTDHEKRLLAAFAAHLGAALGRGSLPALGSLQWLDPTHKAGEAPGELVIGAAAQSAETPATPAVLPARRRAQAVSAKPKIDASEAPSAAPAPRRRTRPRAA
jgi:hypothetical protein